MIPQHRMEGLANPGQIGGDEVPEPSPEPRNPLVGIAKFLVVLLALAALAAAVRGCAS